jgi:hypothetical protein
MISDESMVSVCFVTDGKLSVTADKKLEDDENSPTLSAQFHDKLSLLISIPFKDQSLKSYQVILPASPSLT